MLTPVEPTLATWCFMSTVPVVSSSMRRTTASEASRLEPPAVSTSMVIWRGSTSGKSSTPLPITP